MDVDHSGRLSKSELKSGLRDLGVDITREELDRVVSKFSAENGSIRFRDFVK